jgi:hypothetical protein
MNGKVKLAVPRDAKYGIQSPGPPIQTRPEILADELRKRTRDNLRKLVFSRKSYRLRLPLGCSPTSPKPGWINGHGGWSHEHMGVFMGTDGGFINTGD